MTTMSPRSLCHIALACMIAMLCIPCAAWAVSAPAALTFRAEPSPGSKTDPEHSYYKVVAKAGANVQQSIDLSNTSSRPLVLRLMPAEATTGPLGGVSYAAGPRSATGKAAWLTINRRAIRLRPGASTRVMFAVRIPKGAKTGAHVIGLTIEAIMPEAGGHKVSAQGASIKVHNRRVIAVQVQVPGPALNKIVIERVSAVARPDAMYLQVKLRNSGTTLSKATGDIVVTGSGRFRRAFQVDTTVPATTIEYPIKWSARPRAGTYRARVSIRYAGQSAHWKGAFKVGGTTLRQYANRSGTPAPRGASPNLWLAGIALMAFAVAATLILQRLLRRASSKASDARP